ncbi:MAG: hypothetical protein HWQ44_00470 [Nostoc sp. JL34]|uniref:hypothetical protein n=1 Tax=Nostoc sp. JL34 TaxID=2815397 RepID=UPI001E1161C0|nr:hypothetical protein [Nostoc sp. JL34]MBN3881487.1 hypothetical protein [Nostoc sp. JL34]
MTLSFGVMLGFLQRAIAKSTTLPLSAKSWKSFKKPLARLLALTIFFVGTIWKFVVFL